jgi:hypothetical protein
MVESSPYRRFFPLEAASALSMIGLGLANFIGAPTGLHSIIAVYIFAGGIFLSAIAIRRRRGPPTNDLADGTNGLVKAIEKLCGAKPYGFICLAIAPLPLGFGGFGLLVFLLLYLSSVNAMRLTDEELMTWIGAPVSNVVAASKAEVSPKRMND